MSDMNIPPGFGEPDPQFMQEEYKRSKKERGNGEGTGAPMLFLKKGLTEVRVLPTYTGAKAWFAHIREHNLHPEGSFTSFTCPRHFGQNCPVCEKGQELYDQRTEESIQEARYYQAKDKYFYNVIVYSSPEGLGMKDGVKVMKSGSTVWKDLLDLDQDVAGGYGDITNLEKGWDVRIDRQGDGLGTRYIVKAIPAKSNIMERLSGAGLDPMKVLKPHNLADLYPPRSYEDLEAVLLSNSPPNKD